MPIPTLNHINSHITLNMLNLTDFLTDLYIFKQQILKSTRAPLVKILARMLY